MRGSRTKGRTTMNNSEASKNTEGAALAEQGAYVAPKTCTSKKAASRKANAPKNGRGAEENTSRKQAKTGTRLNAKRVDARPGARRANSKKTAVIALLRRKDGATITEIAEATGWQNHSIRGFISGTVGKKMGMAIESAKNNAGDRTYKVAAK